MNIYKIICVIAALTILGGCSHGSNPSNATAATTASANTTVQTESPSTPQKAYEVTGVGSNRFSIDNAAFTMNDAPNKMLTFLGNPIKTEQDYDYDRSPYPVVIEYYEYSSGIVLCTEAMWDVDAEKKIGEEYIADIYFTTSQYSVNGIRVGDPVKNLSAFSKSILCDGPVRMAGNMYYADNCYNFYSPRNKDGSLLIWRFFTDEDVSTVTGINIHFAGAEYNVPEKSTCDL